MHGYADHVDREALGAHGRSGEAHPLSARMFATGTPITTLLHLQRTIGNAAVNRLLRQYTSQGQAGGRGMSSAGVMLQRCGAKACDCSSEEREAHDANQAQEGAALGQAVQRKAVQGEDELPDPPDRFKPDVKPQGPSDPGGPLDTGDKGFTCGTENGKWTCHVNPGMGDDLNVPGDMPSNKPGNQPDLGNKDGCQPERWNPPSQKNLFHGRCCNVDQVYDQSAQNCVPAPPKGKESGDPADPAPQFGPPAPDPDPIVVPPATPEQPGDYQTPEDDPDSQVA